MIVACLRCARALQVEGRKGVKTKEVVAVRELTTFRAPSGNCFGLSQAHEQRLKELREQRAQELAVQGMERDRRQDRVQMRQTYEEFHRLQQVGVFACH